MNRQYKKIFGIYLSANLPHEINDIVKGWLTDKTDDPALDTVCWEYFDISVTYREPTPGTYRQLRKLEHKLGFEKQDIIQIPLTKRIGIRVAAVLVFMLIAVTALFHTGRTPVPEVPEFAAETPAVKPETEVFEIVTEPNTVTEPAKTKNKKLKNESLSYDTRISAPAGSHRSVTLPDKSIVLINCSGQIAYSSDKREASLRGEAYFNIKKDNNKPFKVITENFVVEVTGTEFCITDLAGSEQSCVELFSGSVSVQTKAGSIKLRPSQKLILSHATGNIRLIPSKGDKWWTEPISFEDKTLSQILSEVAAYYGVNIIGGEILTNDIGYTIKIDKRSSLEHVLEVMEKCAPEYGYRKEGSSIIVVEK